MRWLMIVMFVSVLALIAVFAAAAWHIWREHRRRPAVRPGQESELEPEALPEPQSKEAETSPEEGQ